MEMRVMALIPDGAEYAQTVEDALCSCIPAEHLAIVHDAAGLADHLGHWIEEPPVLVLYADSDKTLTSLVTFRYLFLDYRIILVLPHDGKNIVAVGHMLQPRVIVFAAEAREQLPMLLKRMWEQQEARHNRSLG